MLAAKMIFLLNAPLYWPSYLNNGTELESVVVSLEAEGV